MPGGGAMWMRPTTFSPNKTTNRVGGATFISTQEQFGSGPYRGRAPLPGMSGNPGDTYTGDWVSQVFD